MNDDVEVFRVMDRGTGRTMRSRRTGSLALFEDLGEARRSANAYRGYYGHSKDFGVQVLRFDMDYEELVWTDVTE